MTITIQLIIYVFSLYFYDFSQLMLCHSVGGPIPRAGCDLWCFLWIQLLHEAVFWKRTLINKLVRSHQPPRNRLILANIEGELGIAIHDRFLHCCVFLWKRQGQGGSAQLDVPTDRQSWEIAEDRVTKFWLTKARHSSTLFFGKLRVWHFIPLW